MAVKKVIALEAKLDGGQQVGQTVGNIKKELKEANLELIAAQKNFGDYSAEAVAAAKKVAGLRDSIQEAKETADLFDPGKKFQTLTGALNAAAGGFAAVQGAQALLGSESEDLQKTLAKVQGALALSQGLSAITDSAKDFQRLGAVIKGPVVAAFTTMKGAIAATGIGLLVIAIGALIGNFEKVKAAVMNFIPGIAKVGEVIGSVINSITDFIGVTSEAERATEKMNKAIDKSLTETARLLETNGDLYDEITRKQIEASANYQKKIKEINEDVTLSEKQKQELIVAYANRANRDIEAAIKEKNKREADEAKASADKAKQEAQRRESEAKAAEEKRLAGLQKEREETKARIERDLLEAKRQRLMQEEENAKAADEQRKKDFYRIDGARLLNAGLQAASDEQTAFEKAAAEARVKIAEEEAKLKEELAMRTSAALGALSEAVGRQTALGKTLAVAGALIDTYKGIAAGVKLGWPLAIPAVAYASATGFNAVKNILKTNVPGKSGGGGSAPGSSAPTTAAPIAPQLATTRLDQQSINAVGNAASRAFVLETDVSSNQERIRRLNRAARIN